ncbi:MAG: S8 family serine peptidase [Jatrophihabitantaceae bacterium]
MRVGGPLVDTPWAQTRLNFQRAWTLTRGQGVRVAVIDTGLDRRHVQLRGTHVAPGHNVIPGFPKSDVTDCSGIGHGTSVTAVIAAQQIDGVHFLGVAPDVTIVPIKQTNTANDKTSNADGIAAGIVAAVAAKARVVNISITLTNPGYRLRAAVAQAARANVVIVAAGGNDAEGQNFPAYPAAYSTEFPNVIAVSASDAKDGIGPFSETGSYINVAAPGVGVVVPAPVRGYIKADGTSFAAPYVTGTVALLLAAHPTMTAVQVRNRIEATADRPPATVPDTRYGYGIVNPFLAVTALRDDSLTAPTPRPAPPLRERAAAPPPDRHLAHVALSAGVVLLGLAVLAVVGAAVLRGQRATRRPAG